MPLKLASHLKTSRHGVYYFRLTIPKHLRALFGKNEVLRSLHTREPAKARKMAYLLTSQLHQQFEDMTYNPKAFNPNDPSTWPTSSSQGLNYEINLQTGFVKADSVEDHKRAMEALGMLKSIPKQPTVRAVIPSVQQYVEPQPPHKITLSKALEAWIKTPLAKTTRQAFQTSINKFIEFRGDIEIHDIKQIDIVKWNNSLLVGDLPKVKPISPRSADNRLQALQSLLNWGYKNEYIHHTTKLATEGKFNVKKSQRKRVTKGADAFTIAELNSIFSINTYNGYCEGSPARHWFPLIGIYAGLRREEIAQLTKGDIKQAGGIDYIDVRFKVDKSVKTDAGDRQVPIHKCLIDLGFLDYVRSVQQGSLWPELRNGKGNAVSKAFIRYIEEIGVRVNSDRSKVFHSTRDTFNNCLDLNGVQQNIKLNLMGHADNSTNTVSYTSPKTLARLKAEGIDQLIYNENVGGVEHTLNIAKSAG